MLAGDGNSFVACTKIDQFMPSKAIFAHDVTNKASEHRALTLYTNVLTRHLHIFTDISTSMWLGMYISVNKTNILALEEQMKD